MAVPFCLYIYTKLALLQLLFKDFNLIYDGTIKSLCSVEAIAHKGSYYILFTDTIFFPDMVNLYSTKYIHD